MKLFESSAVKIIGLKGVMWSGKSTAARYLVERYGAMRLRFAEPLKSMVAALLRENGADEVTIERMIDGDLKDVPTPLLNGRTPRYAMQTIGTEWGRDLMSNTLWIDSAFRRADAFIAAGQTIVLDDVRFINERDGIWQRGGVVFEMKNSSLRTPANDNTPKHESEKMGFPVDALVAHDGRSFATLHASLDFHMTRAGQYRSDRTWAQEAVA